MTPSKKLWSEIKYWIILLTFFIVLFEMISSMILFRKYTYGKLALLHFTERLFSNKSPHEVAFTYEPYIMFRAADITSDAVNVSGFRRKSVPDVHATTSSTDTINIYFFGGGTMYGEGLNDEQTIPSQFVKHYQASNPAKSIRVHNFGVPHYYSKQQLMLLSKLVFEGNRPNIAVFLNGLTDFYPAKMLYYDRPWFSYALQQTFEGKMFEKGDGTFVDSTAALYSNPTGVDSKEYNEQLISKYKSNLRNVASLCDKTGIKSYFFCEPVPFYKYPAKQNTLAQTGYQRFSSVYPALEQHRDSIPNFYFMGNMLRGEKPDAFINDVNYSAPFASKVAKQIFETLKTDLQ